MSLKKAGLISSRGCGPDMPMDARFLVRLALPVLRRVIPEDPYSFWLNIINEQVSDLGLAGFEYQRNNGYGDLVFVLWDCDGGTTDCEECDGDGYFYRGSHEYECRECDGDGYIAREEVDAISTVVISKTGVIDWEQSVNAERRLSS